jgi:WD40 repeat protein
LIFSLFFASFNVARNTKTKTVPPIFCHHQKTYPPSSTDFEKCTLPLLNTAPHFIINKQSLRWVLFNVPEFCFWSFSDMGFHCMYDFRHEGPVWQVSWSHPMFGNLLASCSYDRKVSKKIKQNLLCWVSCGQALQLARQGFLQETFIFPL